MAVLPNQDFSMPPALTRVLLNSSLSSPTPPSFYPPYLPYSLHAPRYLKPARALHLSPEHLCMGHPPHPNRPCGERLQEGGRIPTEGKKKGDDFLIPSDSRSTPLTRPQAREAMAAAPLRSRRPPPHTPGGRCPQGSRSGLGAPSPSHAQPGAEALAAMLASGSFPTSPTLTLGPPLAPEHQRQQRQPNGRGEGAESSASQPPRHGNGSLAATAAPEAERTASRSPLVELTRAPRRRE